MNVKSVKSFNLTLEQIGKLNELQAQDNRSASTIVGMAIEHYYEKMMKKEEEE